MQENLSLAAKLNSEFGIELPKFPLEEDLVPSRYAEAVAKAVAGRRSWEVQADAMTLGFFSFAKFLMYRDLDPRTWPDPTQLLNHPALGGLLRDVINKVSGIHFTASEEMHTLSRLYENMLREHPSLAASATPEPPSKPARLATSTSPAAMIPDPTTPIRDGTTPHSAARERTSRIARCASCSMVG